MEYKKSLGQHLLKSRQLAEKIVSFLGVEGVGRIVEIGPGAGALTFHLLKLGRPLIVVEKDARFASILREKFHAQEITVINEDFLGVDFRDIVEKGQKAAVIGNLPYNRSIDILFHLFSMREFITQMVLMFQREVAERIAATPGSRQYGAVSVISSLYSDIKTLMELSPNDFKPRPEVHSSLLGFTIVERGILDRMDGERFNHFVHDVFMYKRKTLINSLRISTGLEAWKLRKILNSAGVGPGVRAEELKLEDFLRLYGELFG